MAPRTLSHTSAQVLEFESFRQLLRGYSVSELGQGRIAAISPSRDCEWIQYQQQLTVELREFRRVNGGFDFSGLASVAEFVARARIQGTALEIKEIRDIVHLVNRAAAWREIALNPPAAMKAAWNAVPELSLRIIDFTQFLRAFRNKIGPDGTLEDRASTELARIRKAIEKQKRIIQESLRSYARRLAEGGAIQDELVTIRDERFVIPIKVVQKRRVQGVVHGASSSGQTVFIEPLETIEQNNELVRLREEEQAEIHRILEEMTEHIAEHGDAVIASEEVLAELELQFAKARFADDYGCVGIVFPAQKESHARVALTKARHPLLERNLRARGGAIVPISIELKEDDRQLIITGPNTGGKTVALKTLGLLALMAQSGIPVPADRVELPIFDAVLADIGDYQSIEQNLSTFSAHVSRIDSIARTTTSNSLALLDELGSATDPEEGAALAVAIAQHFLQIGCISVISTHHTALKVYGANTRGVVNASVGFNEATLQPTYELKLGVPGASAGINIAQRLGLNLAIIESARARLGTQARDVGQFLDQLHTQLHAVEAERLQMKMREEELAREKARLDAESWKAQQAKVRELEKKLEAVLRDFEYRAREAVAAVQDRAAAQKLSKDAERRISKLRRELREHFDATVVAHRTGADRGDPNAQPQLVQHVGDGDTVKLKSVGRPALVMRKLDEDRFEVEVGAMKMKIGREDIAEVLARASDSPVKAARARGISVSLESEKHRRKPTTRPALEN